MKTYDVPRDVMARQVRCADVMSGCEVVVSGRDNAEVMARMMAHIIEDHGIATPPFELVTRTHAAIRDK